MHERDLPRRRGRSRSERSRARPRGRQFAAAARRPDRTLRVRRCRPHRGSSSWRRPAGGPRSRRRWRRPRPSVRSPRRRQPLQSTVRQPGWADVREQPARTAIRTSEPGANGHRFSLRSGRNEMNVLSLHKMEILFQPVCPHPTGIRVNSLLAAFATGPARPAVTDRGQVDALYRRNRMRVLIAITVGYAIAYTCRLALSVVKKPLIDEGIFSPEELGLIGSALFYTYAFGKLVNGFLADHANMKIFFATGVIASALINIGMGFSTILWLSVALWALNGWFQGFGAPSGDRDAHGLVQQPRARALLRHLEHRAFLRRGTHLLRRRALRRLDWLARRLLGAGPLLHPRGHRNLPADAGPAADARAADGGGLEERSPRPARRRRKRAC